MIAELTRRYQAALEDRRRLRTFTTGLHSFDNELADADAEVHERWTALENAWHESVHHETP